jgi:rhodanese-related sulfurtransferase/glyoxylase-like metal-dependent hydrolase (beta-lactamase superfamily II)
MDAKSWNLIRAVWITSILLGTAVYGAQIKDSESASHGFDAAGYKVERTYDYTGFKVVQFNLPVLSHYSYFLVSDSKALVVDPGRDIQFYLDYAKKEGLTIIGVFLSHSHADFVAGHTEMVKAVGCPVYQSVKSGARYKIESVQEGTTLQVGKAKVVFMDTPGHVLDGTSALVYAEGKAVPELMFSGDYLFAGSVGRPDLVAGTTSEGLATQIYDTWNNKVSKLADSVVVLPAHGAGSLCGAHLKETPFTTIGEERATNPNLQYKNKAEFIAVLLSELQEPPQYFGHNARMNRDGPPLVDWQAQADKAQPAAALTNAEQYYVVDLRNSKDYAAGHVPNSINIGLRGRLETWVGIMVPWATNEQGRVVLCGQPEELKEASHRLHRVGYKAKVLDYGDWTKAALAVTSNKLTDPLDLYQAMQAGTSPLIVDVRLPNEWMGLRIGNVLNLPLNRLAELSARLEPDRPVLAVCNSAYRSSLAMGVLERKGFKDVTSLNGGSEAWLAAGLPTYGAQTPTHVSSTAKRVIPLPERLSAEELKRMLMDLPGTFDLVDVRPAGHFADYRLPGSVNVDVADLVGNPAYLTGAGPLVIVDRDGSLAMVVAGILSQKTQRPIKALYGGLESYWGRTAGMDRASAASTPAPAGPSVQRPSAPVSPPQVPAQPKPTQPSPKKSAGC